jgi:hypothetical protein
LEEKRVEKRKFTVNVNGVEVEFHYNVYLP